MPERDELEARKRDIARRIKALSPPEQLRLAAELLEARQPEIAYQVINRIRDELGILLIAGGRRV